MDNEATINILLSRLLDVKEELTKKIEEIVPQTNDNQKGTASEKTPQQEIMGLLQTLDTTILSDPDVRQAIIGNDGGKYVAAIYKNVIGPIVQSLREPDIIPQGGDIARITQLHRIERDTLFNQQYKDAKMLLAESKRYYGYKSVRDKIDNPKGKIEAIDISASVAAIKLLDTVSEYDFIGKLQEMVGKTAAEETVEPNDFNKLLDNLRCLSGTGADVEVTIPDTDGGKKKISELYNQFANQNMTTTTANIFEQILSQLDDSKIRDALAKKRQKRLNDIKKTILKHQALKYIQLDSGEGKKNWAHALLREALESTTVDLEEVERLLAEVKRPENLGQLTQLENSNPEKYKNAQANFDALKAAKDIGYTGKKVSGYQTEIDLTDIGVDQPITLADIKPEEIDEASEQLFNQYFSNPTPEQIEAAEKSVLEDVKNGKMGPNVRVPRNIFFFSALKRFFGFKTARQKFFEDAIAKKIKDKVAGIADPEFDKEKKEKANSRSKIWELSQEQEANFRKAERKLVLDGEPLTDEEVRRKARAIAEGADVEK